MNRLLEGTTIIKTNIIKRTVYGQPYKRQGAQPVDKFRRLLKQQKIKYSEEIDENLTVFTY